MIKWQSKREKRSLCMINHMYILCNHSYITLHMSVYIYCVWVTLCKLYFWFYMLKLLQLSWPVTRNADISIVHDLHALITQQITCQAHMLLIYNICKFLIINYI